MDDDHEDHHAHWEILADDKSRGIYSRPGDSSGLLALSTTLPGERGRGHGWIGLHQRVLWVHKAVAMRSVTANGNIVVSVRRRLISKVADGSVVHACAEQQHLHDAT